MSITALAQLTQSAYEVCTRSANTQQAITHDIADNIYRLNDNISQLSNSAEAATGTSEQLTQLANQLHVDWRVFNLSKI